MTQPAFMIWPVALSGFRIRPELVGRRISLGAHDDYLIRLELPSDVDDSLVTGQQWRPDARAQVTTANVSGATVITVKRLRVKANFMTKLDYLSQLPANHAPTQSQWQEVEQLRVQATSSAERTLRTFIDLVAVTRRTFDLVIDEPPTATFNQLYVGKPPNRVPFGAPGSSVTMVTGLKGLSRGEARSIQRHVKRGSTAPLAWEQYLEAHRRFVLSDDARPALVEAVTAVEVGLKDAMRRKGRRSKSVVLLANTDRLQFLMKEVADAVLGERYAVADKKNYDLLIKLIQQRHDMVHRGQAPNVKDLVVQLEAVRALLEWLDAKAN